MAVMTGKPVVVVARPGAVLPAKLLAVADAVVEHGGLHTGAEGEALRGKLAAAFNRLGVTGGW